uniref:Uncharacterized protein n=1 Tax=Aegilops tauschii subsp. strangulata TaxID=200361 RepID=A0A453RTH9_AEGTS
EATLMDWWQHAKEATPQAQCKALQSVALLVPWLIWKHRNSCVFDNATPSLGTLIDRIKEGGSWAKAGATGLRVVLPPSWDVH